MVVTVVADVLGSENNGTTVACMNLIRFLKARGDTVRVVCCDEERRGEEGYYIVKKLSLGPALNAVIRKNCVSIAIPDKKVISEALEGCDAVHIMTPFMLARAALREAVKRNIPVTAGFHCQAENLTSHFMMMKSKLANRLVYRNFYNGFYRYVDAVHYPTQFIRDDFEKSVGHKTNGYVISNGVNEIFEKKPAEKPPELEGKFVILFIGRYAREKSHKVLVKAVAKSKYRDNIRLIFAGSGPRKREIDACVKKAGITPPVMEFFTRERLLEAINYSDLYCHPAEIELEGIACLEAISCGLVPVVSDSPRCATKYFAPDEKCIFKCNDSADLARKIDFWIENPALREEYSARCLASGVSVKQSVCMEAMRKMITETAEAKKRRLSREAGRYTLQSAAERSAALSEAADLRENSLNGVFASSDDSEYEKSSLLQ
ncbi:MAG: glycosyltransferase [Clostridia bacterium]|nr:glycosyltransferase [Clostridia bacterium]